MLLVVCFIQKTKCIIKKQPSGVFYVRYEDTAAISTNSERSLLLSFTVYSWLLKKPLMTYVLSWS